MDIPLPDFDFDDEPASSPISPPMPAMSLTCAIGSDPSTSFTTKTKNGLLYDDNNPVYQTKTCTLYIARTDNNFYALKTSTNVKLLTKEYQMYKQVGDCFTIIEAIAFWIQDRTAYIQLELATGGAITNLYSDFPKCEVWRLVSHITFALYQVHSAGFMHLDISPSNILQTTLGDLVIYKLVDFGTVLPIGTFEADCAGAGPYLSPEALYYPDTPYTVGPAADVWSFGAVLYEVITHKRVPRDAEGYTNFRNGTFDFSAVPDEFSFVVKMLDPNPNMRPTIQELSQLPQVVDEISNLFMRASSMRKPHYRALLGHTTMRRTSFDAI